VALYILHRVKSVAFGMPGWLWSTLCGGRGLRNYKVDDCNRIIVMARALEFAAAFDVWLHEFRDM
jgi:hypothetical protein